MKSGLKRLSPGIKSKMQWNQKKMLPKQRKKLRILWKQKRICRLKQKP